MVERFLFKCAWCGKELDIAKNFDAGGKVNWYEDLRTEVGDGFMVRTAKVQHVSDDCGETSLVLLEERLLEVKRKGG